MTLYHRSDGDEILVSFFRKKLLNGPTGCGPHRPKQPFYSTYYFLGKYEVSLSILTSTRNFHGNGKCDIYINKVNPANKRLVCVYKYYIYNIYLFSNNSFYFSHYFMYKKYITTYTYIKYYYICTLCDKYTLDNFRNVFATLFTNQCAPSYIHVLTY